MDVGDETAVEQGFDEVATTLGTPDIVINSAGLNMTGTPVAEMAAEQRERLLRTDLQVPS